MTPVMALVATYRYRHGHTTAHRPTARQAADLHLRKDIITARVLMRLPQISSGDPPARHHLAHVHDANEPGGLHATGVRLEPDHEKSMIIRLPADDPERKVRVPRRRLRRRTQKQGIVND